MRRSRELSECNMGCDGSPDGEPVIRNLLLLGANSKNRRRYTREAMEDALPMYQDRLPANLDHGAPPHSVRSIKDRIGMYENVRLEADGIRGDLRYCPVHPFAPALAWFSANMPDCLGISHAATGSGHDEDGVFVVDRIVNLVSADIVADPATTSGLFSESRQPGNTWETLELLCESLIADPAFQPRRRPGRRPSRAVAIVEAQRRRRRLAEASDNTLAELIRRPGGIHQRRPGMTQAEFLRRLQRNYP